MEVKPISLDDEALFASLRGGNHQLIDELYVRHREAFITYAQRQLFATEADATDCFQDAVIAFYKNVVNGRLMEMTCSIRTYLFAIGKRLVYRCNQKRQREAPTDPTDSASPVNDPSDELDLSLLNRFEDDHRKALLAGALAKLGGPCQQLLTLFYYHRYPIESIQNTLDFSSPGATRIKKMRCLGQLKKILTPRA